MSYSQTAQEFLFEAKQLCLNRAEMARLTQDDFIINDYIALAHHFSHGIELLDRLGTAIGGLETFEALWKPYLELALELLGKQLDSMQVESL